MIGTERPAPNELIPYFGSYIAKAIGDDLFSALQNASDRTWGTIQRIPTGSADHRYAPGKWSIKEVFQHLIDTERIFCYRALRFSRRDPTELPGYDENSYIDNASTDRREFHHLLEEHEVVRSGTTALFRSFSEEMLLRRGIANGNAISVRAIGWTIAGHAMHHLDVIDQRYLELK